jgi:hypothetical protein
MRIEPHRVVGISTPVVHLELNILVFQIQPKQFWALAEIENTPVGVLIPARFRESVANIDARLLGKYRNRNKEDCRVFHRSKSRLTWEPCTRMWHVVQFWYRWLRKSWNAGGVPPSWVREALAPEWHSRHWTRDS